MACDESVVLRAREAAAELRRNAAATEEGLRPAAPSLAAVREAGLLRLTVPRDAGGSGASALTTLCAIVELGQGCPSTAWVVALSTAQKLMLPDLLSGAATAELFADPDAIVCESGNTGAVRGAMVPGGLRVNGHWPVVSGCEDASLGILLVPVPESAEGVVAILARIKDFTVERTWRVAGMAGSGSHALLADQVFVPAANVVSFAPVAGKPEPSPAGLLHEMLYTLGASLGATLAARDQVEALLNNGKAPFGTTYERIVDSPLARHWFTEATQLADTALQRCLTLAATLDAEGPRGAWPVRERSTARLSLITAARECRQAMDLLLDLHGASAFAQSNPIQRLWRDVSVATRHAQFSPYITAEDYGRVRFDAGAPAMPLL
ncbi:acyl-CoA dehydrogenase family protein [Actinoplanes sp. NPDC049265]|uniref:acyl-CoA dehydrogenase family protein n=1 Tax=Actinoplanes sp. NPDC049265 TaxID=3363902 RepID=UPI0037113795